VSFFLQRLLSADGPTIRGYFADKVGEAELPRFQAFLKEWVHRSVQIATERLNGPEARARLRTEDFTDAMDEMKRFAEGSTGRIVGFVRPG
jgi:hypothetical protein